MTEEEKKNVKDINREREERKKERDRRLVCDEWS